MHVGVVRVAGEKMAKSAKNLVLTSELLRDHSPAALRLLLLRRPWNASWDFDAGEFAAVEADLEALFSASARHGGATNGAAAAEVVAALRADLDVPAALRIALDEGGTAARTLVEILGLR
jgi:cysteinyl-tRNA synthetase